MIYFQAPVSIHNSKVTMNIGDFGFEPEVARGEYPWQHRLPEGLTHGQMARISRRQRQKMKKYMGLAEAAALQIESSEPAFISPYGSYPESCEPTQTSSSQGCLDPAFVVPGPTGLSGIVGETVQFSPPSGLSGSVVPPPPGLSLVDSEDAESNSDCENASTADTKSSLEESAIMTPSFSSTSTLASSSSTNTIASDFGVDASDEYGVNFLSL